MSDDAVSAVVTEHWGSTTEKRDIDGFGRRVSETRQERVQQEAEGQVLDHRSLGVFVPN